jgi:hypothetical protein
MVMGLREILLYGVVRIMTGLLAGVSLAFDVTGYSVWNTPPNKWGIIGLIAFGVFVLLTLAGEMERRMQPRPKIEFDGLSPARNIVSTKDLAGKIKEQRWGYFFRIAFKNNAKNPSGENSISHATHAHICLFDRKGELDNWDGRWPANSEPTTYAEKVVADRLDILPNDEPVILDVGMRGLNESDFQGWDNIRYIDFGGQQRKSIPPGLYALKVTLAATNFKKKDWWFKLIIPDAVQTDDLNQVHIESTKKRDLHRAGFQLQ